MPRPDRCFAPLRSIGAHGLALGLFSGACLNSHLKLAMAPAYLGGRSSVPATAPAMVPPWPTKPGTSLGGGATVANEAIAVDPARHGFAAARGLTGLIPPLFVRFVRSGRGTLVIKADKSGRRPRLPASCGNSLAWARYL